MKKFLLKLSLFLFLALVVVSPMMVSAQALKEYQPPANSPAQACATLTGIGNLLCRIQKLLNAVLPVLIALGVVYFVWGVVQYVIADGEEAKTKGRDRIIYGIIGFAVIGGLTGLVNIVVRTFGLSGAAPTTSSIVSAVNSGCTLGTDPKFQDLLAYVTNCIINNSVIPLIFAIALASFIWGVVQFVINSDEEAKKEKGRQFMIWGIIALTVMLSVWSLVFILGSTFGLNTKFLPGVSTKSQKDF